MKVDGFTASRLARHIGFTLLVLMTIALLAMVALPSLGGSLAPARYHAIIENLRAIDNQKQLWAARLGKDDHDTPSETDLLPTFPNGKFPTAVMGETYHINPVGQRPTATAPSRLKLANMTIKAGGLIVIPDK